MIFINKKHPILEDIANNYINTQNNLKLISTNLIKLKMIRKIILDWLYKPIFWYMNIDKRNEEVEKINDLFLKQTNWLFLEKIKFQKSIQTILQKYQNTFILIDKINKEIWDQEIIVEQELRQISLWKKTVNDFKTNNSKKIIENVFTKIEIKINHFWNEFNLYKRTFNLKKHELKKLVENENREIEKIYLFEKEWEETIISFKVAQKEILKFTPKIREQFESLLY